MSTAILCLSVALFCEALAGKKNGARETNDSNPGPINVHEGDKAKKAKKKSFFKSVFSRRRKDSKASSLNEQKDNQLETQDPEGIVGQRKYVQNDEEREQLQTQGQTTESPDVPEIDAGISFV